MNELKIEYLPPESLTPYENNTRKHSPDDIDGIKKSILDTGFNDPIGVWGENNLIVEGHGRQIAALELHLDKVPVIRLDHMTDEQRREYAIRHNRSAELSAWDFDTLAEELAQLEIDGIDMTDLEFDLPDAEAENIEAHEDEYDKPIPEEPRSKVGDLYQLGNHRLMCGDSTDAETVDTLMGGVKADMVFTDPPYGVSYEGGMQIDGGHIKSNGKQQIKNDSLGYDGLYTMLSKAFTNIKKNTVAKSGIYVFYAHSRSREFLNAFHDSGLKQRSILIWHKTSGGFGDFMAQYMNAYEPFIYGSNGDAVNWYGATNEKTVWDLDKEKKCDLHPTMKPIALVARAIQNSSKKSDNVLDLFGGSGSTLIACEQTGRKCYMMELDPHYVDVIIDRWETFTGQKAVLLNDPERTPEE